MRFIAFQDQQAEGLAVEVDGIAHGLTTKDPSFPGRFDGVILVGCSRALAAAAAVLKVGRQIDLSAVKLLPPLRTPEKVGASGVNYRDHSAEFGFKQPDYPTLFNRFNSSLIGAGAPIVRPRVSTHLDYEGELVAVIGKGNPRHHQGQCARRCRRLFDLQRRIGARLSIQVAAMDDRQEF